MADNKKQWFLLILAAAWLLVVLAITVCVYLSTQALPSFGLTVFTVPPIGMLRQLYHYHFPPSAADYEIQKLKLQVKSDQARNQKRTGP